LIVTDLFFCLLVLFSVLLSLFTIVSCVFNNLVLLIDDVKKSYKDKGFNLDTLTHRHWKNTKTDMTIDVALYDYDMTSIMSLLIQYTLPLCYHRSYMICIILSCCL
jgi:hypothetical protein